MANLVGIVLLVGLTLVGAVLVVVIGSSALGTVTDQTQDDVAEDSMREMSARIGSVADSSVDASSSFSFSDGVARNVEVRTDSQVTIAVTNRSGASIPDSVSDQMNDDDVYTFPGSTPSQPLGTILYERSDGSLVAYQGGGLWSIGEGRTQVLEEPNLDYDGLSVDFSLVNVTGEGGNHVAGDREVVARNDVAESRQSAREVYDQIQGAWNTSSGGVVPVNMTVTIEGPLADGWADYANESMTEDPASVEYDGDNNTVQIELADLGRESGNSSGSGSGTGGSGSGGGPGPAPGEAMEYDSTDNSLTVRQSEAEIGLHSAEIGQAVEVQVGDEGRSPMDVVFAIDETGSLVGADGEPTDPDGERLEATRAFIDELNASHGDRAGYVQFAAQGLGYTWSGLVPSHEGIVGYHDLTANHGAVKADLSEHAEGYTDITRGIDVATEVHANVPDPNEKRVMVVLTDGENNEVSDASTIAAAERANETHGIVVHVVGLGDGVDQSFLGNVASEGGGDYHHVNDAGGLEDVFDDIREQAESETRYQINRTETVVQAHQAVTETLNVAGSENVNDPTEFNDESPTPVTRPVTGLREDGALSFTLELRTCTDHDTTDVTDTDSSTGTVYNHTRCASGGSEAVTVDNSSTTDHVVVQDGNSTSALSGLDTEWWHSDPVAVLSPEYVSGSSFDLEDNESIVALTVDDSNTGQTGYVLLHVEVDEISGSTDTSSTSSATGTGVDPITIGYSEIAVS